MLRRNIRVSSLGRSYRPSGTPGFVIKNNSLAGIDRTNKFFIPLHLYKSNITKKAVPNPEKTAEKREIIPPKRSSATNQKGTGTEDPLNLLKYPIKV